MPSPPPDWQLPPGVSRGLWDYFHNETIARTYDAALGAGALTFADCPFVKRHCSPPGRLIDLGCGTGRLAADLARDTWKVVGVDLSPAMLTVAREKAVAAGVQVDFVQANLVDLGCFADASFDYAACLFSTLGMVVGHEARERVLQHVHRLLRPGGVFVLHVHNRWFNVWDRAGRRWLLADFWRRTGDRPMPPLTLHHFTRREIVRLLRRVGFAVNKLQPVSLRPDGKLRCSWWLGWLRAYGYLIAAVKGA
jgi:ubiquinone/menaquinone biosynthesis C-methylase UbiE